VPGHLASEISVCYPVIKRVALLPTETAMSTIDLYLPVSKIRFIRWLRHYVKSTRDESVPTPQGAITIGNLTVSRQNESWPSVTIDGIISITDDALAAMSPTARLLADTLYYDHKQPVAGLVNFWLGQNETRLNVRATCNDPALFSYFEALVTAIHNRWLNKTQKRLADSVPTSKPDAVPVTATPVLPQRPSGRPANADDEWAWCEVRLNGRSSKEVYAEWLARIGSRAKLLVDPLDSFRKATKPNRLAGKYGKSGNSDTELAGK